MDGRYRERAAAPDLTPYVACAWTRTVGVVPGVVLPDGCMDILWFDDGTLQVAGTDTGPNPSVPPPGTSIVALRFRPGVAPAVLGVPAYELRDARVPLAELWGAPARLLADRLADAPGPAVRVGLLATAARQRLAGGPPVDPVARLVADRLDRPRRDAVRAVAVEAGLSERQLHRRCTAAFGYGPVMLARVLRLQRFLALAGGAGPAGAAVPRGEAGPAGGLAALAAATGYADQPHLSRECRALAGVPASDLLRRPTAVPVEPGVRSVHDGGYLRR